MSYLVNNQQKINEIVFANRNKRYGAYVMRSTYGSTVFKSLAFMLLGFGTMLSLAFYFSNRVDEIKNEFIQVLPDEKIYSVEVNLDKKEQKSPKKYDATPPQKNNSASTAMSTRVKDSLVVETSTVVNVDIVSTGTGSTSISIGTPDPNSGGSGSGTGTGNSGNDGKIKEDIVFVADKEPEFEGGLRALYQFVGSKLKYPEDARTYGKEGTVYVRFVVDQNGHVGSLSLLNALGYGLDEEALRVVAMIPKFKSPAIVNGKPVKVYYQLPIKFKMRT